MSKPFFDTLRDLRQGAALDELADELAALVHAVRECNKAGGRCRVSGAGWCGIWRAGMCRGLNGARGGWRWRGMMNGPSAGGYVGA